MKKKFLRFGIIILSVALILASVTAVIAAADSGTSAQDSDYTPTVMYGDDFSSKAWSALGANTSKESKLITYDGNSYTLLRPGVTSDSVAETRYDIGLSSRKQGDARLINLKSFTNSSGQELTYACTTKYVVYDFDIGSETDLTDGLIFQLIARKIKSSTSTALTDQSMAGTINLYIADDETSGNLLIGNTNSSYVDTGISIDNAFAHITIVVDLNKVISDNDPSKTTAYVYVNGKNTGISATGFNSAANYFDMARLTMTDVASKATDSLAIDNYSSHSFGTDYNGNLASILADSSKDLSDFDCGIYNAGYRLPTIRPLAKIKNEAINTNKELRAAASSGDYVRFMRPANYYLPTGVSGVTEYAPAEGTLYATFDAKGALIAEFTDSDSYHADLEAAAGAVYAASKTDTAYAEIYKDITVVAKQEIWDQIVVSLNGHTITYDAASSSNHFITGTNRGTISYVGPGTIKATDCYKAGTTTPRNVIYIQQNRPKSVLNFENVTFDTYGESVILRSGTVNFNACTLSWSKTESTFCTLIGVLDGSTSYTSPKVNINGSTVNYTGADSWKNYFLVCDSALVTSGTEFLKTNRSEITVRGSILNLNNANVIHTKTTHSPADNPAVIEPTLSIIDSEITGCRRFAPVNANTNPTINIVNSKIAPPTTGQFVQDGASGSSPVINLEDAILGSNPKEITGKINLLNGNKVFSTTDTKYPYVITKPAVKANISLNSDFNFNFYIPKDVFVSAMANSEALASGDSIVIGGSEYVSVVYEGIAPSAAGISTTVSITMKYKDVSYTAKYSACVPNYIKQVSAKAAAGSSDSARSLSLMAAIVNYVDSAYIYFGKTEGIDVITELKDILSEEIAALADANIGSPINTMDAVSDAISSAKMVIESVPKLRFTLKASYSGTVTVNGTDYTVVNGKCGESSYIDINVRAKNISSTVTVRVGSSAAQFNIASYYNYLLSEGETGAVALLDALYVYGAEARRYVAHTYDKSAYAYDENYHWHVCTDSLCNVSSAKAEHDINDSGACECGYVYGDVEEMGNFLNSLGIAKTARTDRDDMKFAKVLDNCSASYIFTDEDKSEVKPGDVILFSFAVKAKDVSVPLNIKADLGTVINNNSKEDSKTMTYYVPVQWTRIYMPIASNGMSEVKLETDGTVYIAEAKFENYGSTDIETLNLKSGMWMIDEFDKVELSGSETYLNSENKTGRATAVKLSGDGKYLFSIGYDNTGTFSITDTQTGDVVGQLTGLGSELRQLAVTKDDKFAMITSRASGACIIDMTDKTAPALASSYNTVELATGLYISGNYAFITNRYHGVEVVDITDPTKPVQKANIYTGGEVQSCVVHNGYLYCGVWGECGIWIYDLSQLEATANLTRVGKVTCNGRGDGLSVTEIGGRTYIFAATGQHTYNASTSEPFQNLAYGQGNGLDIFDVTDPSSPIHISTSKIDGRYYYTGNDFWEAEVSYDEVSGKYYAYLVNTYNGVYVYDVTNLSAPVRLAHITLPLYNGTVLQHSSRTIITSWDQSAEARSAVGSIAVNDGVIYLAGVASSVHKYESTALFHPIHEGEADNGDELIIGDVYSNLETGLRAEDYSFWSENNGQILSISTHGSLVYVAAGSDGILVFDKNTFGASARPVYTYAPKTVNGRVGFASSIEIKNGRLYCAEDVAGLGVYTINTDGSLTEIEGLRYQNTAYVISQVRVSPGAGYAVVQINSTHVGVIPLNYDTGTHGDIKLQKLDGGHLYHRNLSDVIGGRYIIAWNHVGYTVWIDFGDENDTDSTPSYKIVTDSYMSTMTNGIAAHKNEALFIGWNNYRLYSDAESYSGNYTDHDKTKFSGKPTVCGNYLVVTRHDDGMIYILDISDITSPEVIHTIDTVGNPDIAYYDGNGTVYIPLGNQGLLTIDLNAAFGTSD